MDSFNQSSGIRLMVIERFDLFTDKIRRYYCFKSFGSIYVWIDFGKWTEFSTLSLSGEYHEVVLDKTKVII